MTKKGINKKKKVLKKYNFPTFGVVIEAENLEKATSILISKDKKDV